MTQMRLFWSTFRCKIKQSFAIIIDLYKWNDNSAKIASCKSHMTHKLASPTWQGRRFCRTHLCLARTRPAGSTTVRRSTNTMHVNNCVTLAPRTAHPAAVLRASQSQIYNKMHYGNYHDTFQYSPNIVFTECYCFVIYLQYTLFLQIKMAIL